MAGWCYAALDSSFKCRVGGIFLMCSITYKLLTKVKEWKQSKASSAQLKPVPEPRWAASPCTQIKRAGGSTVPRSPGPHIFVASLPGLPIFLPEATQKSWGLLGKPIFLLPPSEVRGARWGLVLWAPGLFPKAKNVCIDENSLDHVQENLVHCLSVDLASHQE